MKMNDLPRTKFIRKNLLTVGADSKTVKGEKFGFLTGIQYLSPFNISGVNLCPFAEVAKCHFDCLFFAGRGRMNATQSARLKKTMYYLENRAYFFDNLFSDIAAVIRKAERENLTPVIRLNGTSDILFERQSFTRAGIEYQNIFEAFPNVQFYDYTKDAKNRDKLPANYDLTFSLSGAEGFARFNALALAKGMRAAAVFRDRLPAEFMGRKVINGDESDLRFLDDKNVIIGLKAKGRARHDKTGFVFDI